MTETTAAYRALSPVPKEAAARLTLSPPLPDLAGRTICALRHTFRADETFPMIEALLKERFPGVRFLSNHEMPDARPATPEEEEELIAVLREKGAEAVLVGNGA